MQEANDRIKRRRLNVDEEDDLPQDRLLHATAGVDANADLTHLLLRQRLQQQQAAAAAADVGFANSLALARASDSASLLTGGGGGAGASSGDPMVAHLRQNLLNQQLQQAARLQAVAATDDLSYLRASEAAGMGAPPSIYASLLGGPTGSHHHHPLSNSLLLEQALVGGGGGGNDAVGPPSLAEQISQRGGGGARRGSAATAGVGPDHIRASYMQSLLEAEREEAAAAAAVAAEGGAGAGAGGIRHLLGLTGGATAADVGGGGSQASLLARLQRERAMAAAAAAATMGPGPGGPFTPGGLHSLISRAPVGAVTAAGLNGEYLLAARGGGGPGGPGAAGLGPPHHPGNYLGMSVPGAGAAGAGGLPPGHHHPMPPKKRPAPTTNPNSTGRQPIHLFMSCDMDDLSPYQCLVRKQIELFEAEDIDAETNARGRNRPIVVGQVGIRCKHCKHLPPRKRERAAIYYPSKLDRLYQAGQTMASVHLGQHCNHIPEHLRQELARLREGKSAALAGKKYWSDGARALGVIEDDDRLFFKRD